MIRRKLFAKTNSFFCLLKWLIINNFIVMEDLIRYDFADMHIYGSYMIVIMNEGVHVTPEHNQVLINITDTYYKNKKFVYITHRINSYSVDPKVYIETSKIENLAGFCVVSKTTKHWPMLKLKSFF